jgi:[methyl-Co(III) methanol-specific corrinoid protein]:coenzyme M methyltransferase
LVLAQGATPSAPTFLMNPRDEILALLNGQHLGDAPCFSGLIHITSAGLESEGLIFHEVHKDAKKMARASASTYKLTGFPSAVVPLDLYVEAEALGAEIDYREHEQYEFPSVKNALFGSVKEFATERTEIVNRGRVKLVCDAIRMLKEDIGDQAVIGAWMPGPFTLMTLLVEPAKLFLEMKREPEIVHGSLKQLSALLSKVGRAYRRAGADYLTIHDMGGSPAFIGPARLEQFVLPALKDLIADLPKPRVLSICGNTNTSIHLIAQAGAEAISVDQTNDLLASRMVVGGETLLFGNVDPVATLSLGSESDVRQAVAASKEAGVDAVWPGCDLALRTPIQNLRAMIE